MKKLEKGAELPRLSTAVDAQKVTTGFYVKLDKHDDVTYLIENVTFDFTGCSADEILELAARSAKVWYQGKWRSKSVTNAERVSPAKWERTVDVKQEMLEAERAPVDPFTAVMRGIGKLTDAQKAAVKEALGL